MAGQGAGGGPGPDQARGCAAPLRRRGGPACARVWRRRDVRLADDGDGDGRLQVPDGHDAAWHRQRPRALPAVGPRAHEQYEAQRVAAPSGGGADHRARPLAHPASRVRQRGEGAAPHLPSDRERRHERRRRVRGRVQQLPGHRDRGARHVRLPHGARGQSEPLLQPAQEPGAHGRARPTHHGPVRAAGRKCPRP